jgi:hypothetical protein
VSPLAGKINMTSHSENNDPSQASLAPSSPPTPSQATRKEESLQSHENDASSAGMFVPTRTSQITSDSPISTALRNPSQTSTPVTTGTDTVPTSEWTRNPHQQKLMLDLLKQSQKTQALLHQRQRDRGQEGGDPPVKLESLK